MPRQREGGIIARVAGRFVPGLRLAGEFYAEAVRPLLDAEFPGLGYAAALLGPGSEVLGFDTERSTDHDWGPRLCVFLGEQDAERLAGQVGEMLAGRLPATFRGYPVAFGVTRDPASGSRHRVEALVSAPSASPPRCPALSPTRWSGTCRRPVPPTRSSTAPPPWAISATRGPSSPHSEANYAQPPRRYLCSANRHETLLLSDRDMSVPGVRDTQT